ncbi:polyribonucleotide nucleotidyltransferase [Putridiphycobacter roseus]|uniref:Polyribonucleotide nucleotidyltransferase n=1 Tax=Putridiphycobacter roseus TaxID=2219161 RepID=A0A2W1MVA3_9FLAO|nr:polyribonucleotide nucleotidyltransferase [Putridiphycobacter roseus]PZE16019.1 polyribonucleotide nucleotidyltransferase [Putridiphycobacter roseus]
MNVITKTIDLGNGTEISVETGKLAKQSDGSVVVKAGGTMILATVVSNKGAKEGVDFLPLTVDYREKFYSNGKIPGGYLKREARPSDDEILIMRLVDRALRPLFPSDYHADTQLMMQLISFDGVNMPDSLAGFAASAAIAVSDIPFNGPMSEVRVGRIDGKFIVNPTFEQFAASDLDCMIAGTAENIVMLEGEMLEISEEDMVEIIKVAHVAIKEQCAFQLDLASNVEKAKVKREYAHETHDETIREKVKAATYEKCMAVAREGNPSKEKRSAAFDEIKQAYIDSLTEEELAVEAPFISVYFKDSMKAAVRQVILHERVRLDGRNFDEIRPIWSEVNYLPSAHGSALFTRGETQSLTSLTLGGKLDEQMIDSAQDKRFEKFMLHYNFPPFSTGEARPIRGVSRREIGHGNLALRALKNMLPQGDENPYTIRLVSEILESNGSSSMATVCAGTMALLDGGIKMKRPVSGIAMGLIIDETGTFAVLSDILGDEDHLGDMDFKVTGTEKGITACQMDIKVDGLPYEVLIQALNQAKSGRAHILGEMMKTISQPATEMKSHAPRIVGFTVPNDMIGAIIGPGGKIIQEIQKETETTITIEELPDGQGSVQILATNADAMDAAVKRIKLIAFPPTVEVGEIYEGKVKSIQSYGCFVEILPGTDGLIHISELEHGRVEKVEDVCKEGDVLKFKVIGVDPKTKKYKLSRKVLLPKPEAKEEA